MSRWITMVTAACLLAYAAPARADYWADFVNWWYSTHDAPPEGAPPGFPPNPRNAPEPLTLVGLGAGAGAIALAGWRARRRSR
jgi:hypothetical protein